MIKLGAKFDMNVTWNGQTRSLLKTIHSMPESHCEEAERDRMRLIHILTRALECLSYQNICIAYPLDKMTANTAQQHFQNTMATQFMNKYPLARGTEFIQLVEQEWNDLSMVDKQEFEEISKMQQIQMDEQYRFTA